MMLNPKTIKAVTLIAAIGFATLSNAQVSPDAIKLLTAQFEARDVVQVEIGDFHFKPGQVAPVHTHAAPAVGYVAKGEIIYQVEGEKQQLLREGDVFFEPVGPRILRFDNASATEQAIFIDFNLQQVNEPFIVFEKPPTEAIDRRSLPTVDIVDRRVDQVNIYTNELHQSETVELDTNEAILGLVAEGIVELRIGGNKKQRIVAGASFSIPKSGSVATVANVSSEVTAKIITFNLR